MFKLKSRTLLHTAAFLVFTAMPFTVVMPAHSAQPTIQQFELMLDVSGTQRMLTQKMAKEALMIHKGINVEENKKNLMQTTEIFEKNLTGLKNGDSAAGLPEHDLTRIKGYISQTQDTYNTIVPLYRKIASGSTVSSADLDMIDVKTQELLDQAERIVVFVELEARASTGIGDQEHATLINLAGRQRMLSQKIAKEYALWKNGINAEESELSMYATMGEFQKSLRVLREGDARLGIPDGIQDPRILSQIDTVEGLWSNYKAALRSTDENSIEQVGSINMDILKEANKAVQMLIEQENKTTPSS